MKSKLYPVCIPIYCNLDHNIGIFWHWKPDTEITKNPTIQPGLIYLIVSLYLFFIVEKYWGYLIVKTLYANIFSEFIQTQSLTLRRDRPVYYRRQNTFKSGN
ncbi:MAG: hypothetical protein DRP96_12140 [Candidatus Neomarinimicrobiota bacterium]|nr:MAG: hypothetical protein DRP96_12140 [Candidatus Neomarinimicrobiota bacterium]